MFFLEFHSVWYYLVLIIPQLLLKYKILHLKYFFPQNFDKPLLCLLILGIDNKKSVTILIDCVFYIIFFLLEILGVFFVASKYHSDVSWYYVSVILFLAISDLLNQRNQVFPVYFIDYLLHPFSILSFLFLALLLDRRTSESIIYVSHKALIFPTTKFFRLYCERLFGLVFQMNVISYLWMFYSN